MQGNQYRLLTLFADGGVMMYPLVLCSLLALGVIIAKAYTLWTAFIASRRLLGEVSDLAQQGNLEHAIEVTEATPGPVAAILDTGLRRLRDPGYDSEDVASAVKSTGSIELGFLERGLVVLATVSNVAPLLGFLGTVAGMINAFGAIERAGQVEASLVAGGIKIALITTAAGLLIAVPVNLAYNFFVSRIDKLVVEMERGSAAVLNIAWQYETKRAGAASASSPATSVSAGAAPKGNPDSAAKRA
jgi:biopolymer transport protein ExbB